ncbi:hypothetical protein ACWGTO_01115 [Mesorhizobium sp. PL10]
MDEIAKIDRRIVIRNAENEWEGRARKVSDLRREPFVVLLGEPGIGKSTVFQTEAKLEGGTLLRVRQLVNGHRPPPGGTLFIDALDEYRTDGSVADKADKLSIAIAESKVRHWRLSCRSEDWRNAADIAAIQATTGGTNIVVAQLLPLDEEEASFLLQAWGEANPEGFVSQAARMGVTALTENPLSLKLLHKAVQRTGSWPSSRFALMSDATWQLAHEHNPDREYELRSSPGAIIHAAGRATLILLASGALAIWRSNAPPPNQEDRRAFLTTHDVEISLELFGNMLDTPLFRGAGNIFEPMHRVVAEYLAGKTLADAVTGGSDRAALPLSRAVAMVTSADGRPPTELRGLYGWFAAHLAKSGDAIGARQLIEADAVTVLAYGDAAAFRTPERRSILVNIDRDDPYFRSSETGVTAYGGLAGEDLADDFREILMAAATSQRFLTVMDVLTIGPPVHSLRSLLKDIALDLTRPGWHRWRAADAWLNGVPAPHAARLELLDELDGEPPSTGREILRTHLAGELPVRLLNVQRVRSILRDFESSPDDNTVGHLFAFETRLKDEPLPALFAEPTDSWRAPEGQRQRRSEVDHILDRLLAAYIRTCEPTSSEVWQWARNVGGDEFIYLGEETLKALSDWLVADDRREIDILDLVLGEYQAGDRPWLPGNDFFRLARRSASQALVRHLLNNAASVSSAVERKWLEQVAVHLANGPNPNTAAFWYVYDYLLRGRGTKRLLRELTVKKISQHHLRYLKGRIKERRQKDKRRQKDLDILTKELAALRGGKSKNLIWAADRYFQGASDDTPPSICTLEADLGAPIAKAVRDGWARIATQPIEYLDAAVLGRAAGQNKGYGIEHAVIAGIDVLLQEQRAPALATAPLLSAIIALKSDFIVGSEKRRDAINGWAVRRLENNPAAGARELSTFWSAILETGGTSLDGLWDLTRQGRIGRAVPMALEAILGATPLMHENALKQALIAAFDAIDSVRLQQLADAALGRGELRGRQRLLWSFVRFALDPARWRSQFLQEFDGATASDIAFLDWDGEMGKVTNSLDHQLVRLETIARVAGARSTPEDRFGSGWVTDVHHLADTAYEGIMALSASAEAQAGPFLQGLATETFLAAWQQTILHAVSQQARLRRDADFRHPTALQIAEAISGGPPVNASDLRAITTEELKRLRDELRKSDTGDWKMFWNRDGDIPKAPLHENECRDYVLSRLRDRMSKYRIAAAQPEAQRAHETRADMLILTGAGRNLPVEVKRHYHGHLWTAAATQLQGYALAPGSDGLGIYLVIWFGIDIQPTPPRPDGGGLPSTAAEMESMLISDLSDDLRKRTDVIVFDVSRPDAVARRVTTRSGQRGRNRRSPLVQD